MEFLFTDKGASIEALLVLICLGVLLLIFAYDGYVFLRKFFSVFIKNKTLIGEEIKIEEATPKEMNTPSEEKGMEEESAVEGEKDTTSGEVSEETIYAEYVALVDETHAEKEKEDEKKEKEEEIPSDITPEDILDIPKGSSENTEMPTAGQEQIPRTSEGQENENKKEGEKEEIQEENSVLDEVPTAEQEQIPSTLRSETLLAEDGPSLEGQTETDIETTPKEVVQDENISSDKEQKQIENTEAPEAPIKNNTEVLFALVNTIRTVIARGQLVEARALIIQGLSLDKGHRELNLMLGSLYEGETHFEKAEYVYKDLAIEHPDDIEILEKLGNVLIIEKRYSIAIEIYKKILALGGETEGTLYILSHLCHEMNDANEGYLYMKKYLKGWPNNPEILALMSEVEIELDKRKDAIETLKRLKNLTPYNSEIAATLQKLMMEEELAGNFGNNN